VITETGDRDHPLTISEAALADSLTLRLIVSTDGRTRLI
jgi:hypothetical protein